MIVEKTLEFSHSGKLKVSDIENFIKSQGIEPIRYSIIKKIGDKFIISVSGVEI